MIATLKFTLPQLEAMGPRELDAVVAEVVMGYVWKTCPGYDFPLLYRPDAEVDPDDWGFFELLANPHPEVLAFSLSWVGFGLVVERMRERGFWLWVGKHWLKFIPNGRPEPRLGELCVSFIALPSLAHDYPRAASIAAVLAFQGVEV